MSVKTPHYLLFSESRAHRRGGRHGGSGTGQWRFVLETVEGAVRFEAEDEEEETEQNRLELLAVVRGLESLDRPSRVTVVTPSRYVSRGFRYGLEQWRENNWRWESYGEMTPIRNRDLWQRVDRAMRYHEVDCRTWRFDPPETAGPHASARTSRRTRSTRSRQRSSAPPQKTSLLDRSVRVAGGILTRCRETVGGFLARRLQAK